MHCVFKLYYLTLTFLYIIIKLGYKKFKFSMFFARNGSLYFDTDLAQLLIRIRIPGNDKDPADPQQWQ